MCRGWTLDAVTSLIHTGAESLCDISLWDRGFSFFRPLAPRRGARLPRPMSGWLAGNLDYLIFAGVGGALFALLDLWLRRRVTPSRLPTWAWAGLAALVAGGWFFVERAGDAEHARIQGFLQGVAPTYAQELERMQHAEIDFTTTPDDPRYLAMIEAMKRWKNVNPTLSDIYTYRRQDGRVRLLVDAETDYNRDGRIEGAREQRVPIGKEYPQADTEMFQALDGQPSFSARPVQDEWGVWVSAQVPLRDAAGRVEGALGVDYPADAWVQAIALGRQRMEWVLSIPLLILGFGAAISGALRGELEARQAVMARLRESEARLRTAIDNLPCDLWMMDMSLRYTLLNAGSRAKWGDNTGRSLDELQVAQATRQEWAEINRRAFDGEVVRHESAFEVAGRKHHFSSVVAPVRLDGSVVGILGVNFDITPRVEAEAALRRSEEKLALHVRHTPLAVIEWNLAMRVTAWNPSAERIFGYTAAEAMGRAATGLIVRDEDRSGVERVWTALLAHKGGTRATNDNVTKDGRVIHCEWYNTPLIDASGAVIGVASSVQDVTDRDALERQLRQAQKMESIGQLAGGVAHEFNNLLTPMLVQSDLIAQHYAHDRQLVALLRPLQEAAAQAAQLNQRILAVGRRSAEQWTMQPLNPLVENAVALLRPTLDRRIDLRVLLAPGLSPVLADRASIAQIVMNLAINARDTVLEKLERKGASGWTPRITISTEMVGATNRRDGVSASPFPINCQRLTVTDNGLGIPEAQRAHVFEPFYTTKAPGRGTGLGLAVVWSVARSLRGWVEFETGPDGEGTTFHIYLPVSDPPPAVLNPPMEKAPAEVRRVSLKTARPLKLLIVEDNSLVTDTYVAVLGAAGHQVTVADDGERGWEMFQRRTGEFDLVLADCNMPGLTGGELLQRLRDSGFSGRVILVSGYLNSDKLEELMRRGASAVLRKPFTPTKLLAVIEG